MHGVSMTTAWALLNALGLASLLQYAFGVLFIFFLLYIVRSR